MTEVYLAGGLIFITAYVFGFMRGKQQTDEAKEGEMKVSEVTWVYLQSEPGLYTVVFYKPDGKWEPESDHASREEAAERVHYLNGQ